ncbi:hypothetical protein GCM10010910_16510 [Microbacterium nanhaiense]|uniref:Uncharacterized protein n=1 Tax=Microbacterium nanhaiense TaxID=1301026 RepID=A0ABQ2N1Z9_9MICO|nr:hypothetical protein [Microbacterium nanhaiense]GGO63592.1 hypothetical protein GCM10010910_16510 [Microbacterium nanhaiense]
MVRLLVDSDALEVQLSPLERALAVRKESVRIDRAHIRKVQLTEDPFTWLRGVRAPGAHVPGRLAYGTWRSVFGSDFAAVRTGRPGVVIDLEGDDEFERIVVTTRHGVGLVKALQREGVDTGDVAELD